MPGLRVGARHRLELTQPHFVVRERRPLVDTPVTIKIAGLPPVRRALVTATIVDGAGTTFSSWAEYEVAKDGRVVPAQQAPAVGTYEGVDRFGLWWSMVSASGRPLELSLDALPTLLTAEVDGETVATTSLVRLRVGPGVTEVALAGDVVVGSLFLPPARPAPGIIVLGGSDGGTVASRPLAALLASRGFTALALAYFGTPGTPRFLADVPVEYVLGATCWLVEHDAVSGPRVAAVGLSRGGELALVVGAHMPEIAAVVGFAPSLIAAGGYGSVEAGSRPAWISAADGRPWAGARQGEIIPVENTRGSILFVTGDDDGIWPASERAELAMRRLTAAHHAFPDRHLHYPGAGHSAGRPPGLPAAPIRGSHPVSGAPYNLGGTPSANAASEADAWPRVVRFLRRHLA